MHVQIGERAILRGTRPLHTAIGATTHYSLSGVSSLVTTISHIPTTSRSTPPRTLGLRQLAVLGRRKGDLHTTTKTEMPKKKQVSL